jgi:hypothetical protein
MLSSDVEAQLTIFRHQRSGRGDWLSSGRSAVSTMGGSSVSGVTIAVPSLLSWRGERPPIRQDIESLIGSAAAATSDIGTQLALYCYMGTRKQEALSSDPKGLAWRTPVQKELTGLFGQLAAFNERIAELTKLGHQSHAMDVLKAQAISLAAQIDELRCILIVPKQ